MSETRWLDRAATAAYTGRDKADLPRLVRAGKLPAPSYHFGPRSPRWDKLALEALFTGQQVRPSIHDMVQEHAREIAQRTPKNRSAHTGRRIS